MLRLLGTSNGSGYFGHFGAAEVKLKQQRQQQRMKMFVPTTTTTAATNWTAPKNIEHIVRPDDTRIIGIAQAKYLFRYLIARPSYRQTAALRFIARYAHLGSLRSSLSWCILCHRRDLLRTCISSYVSQTLLQVSKKSLSMLGTEIFQWARWKLPCTRNLCQRTWCRFIHSHSYTHTLFSLSCPFMRSIQLARNASNSVAISFRITAIDSKRVTHNTPIDVTISRFLYAPSLRRIRIFRMSHWSSVTIHQQNMFRITIVRYNTAQHILNTISFSSAD